MEKWIVGLGEVLWDVFADGPRFGGAPANFAIHAASLFRSQSDSSPWHVAMVSAIGPTSDPLADPVLTELKQHAVDTRYIDRNQFETGRVIVDVDASGHPTYTFSQHPAWDALQWRDTPDDVSLSRLAAQCNIVCFGTLAQRAAQSRQTIQRFLDAVPREALRVFDVNLRVDFWDEACIVQSLGKANLLKLNDDELPIVAEACGFNLPADADPDAVIQVLRRLVDQFQLKLVALTCGSDGAVLVTDSEDHRAPAPKIKVRDSVGAGDAFTAALVYGLTKGWPLSVINQRAMEVAAYVCTQSGATPKMPAELQASFHRD